LWIAEEFGAALQADGEYEVTVVTGLKHQKEKRSMDHFAGLDVSVKETSVCIVDDTKEQRHTIIERLKPTGASNKNRLAVRATGNERRQAAVAGGKH
jgi:hypothetical protein